VIRPEGLDPDNPVAVTEIDFVPWHAKAAWADQVIKSSRFKNFPGSWSRRE
jgi:hypothetical protein